MSISKILMASVALVSITPDTYHSMTDDMQSISVQRIISSQACFLTAFVMANSSLDQTLHDEFKTQFSSQNSIKIAQNLKLLGNNSTILGYSLAYTALRTWNSIMPPLTNSTGALEKIQKAYIYGTPICLMSQIMIGAPRPSKNQGSTWNFLGSATGVSGHAYAAIPFLVLANLSDDPLTKTFLTSLSLIGECSRLMTSAHYPSQIFLGWIIAKNAADIATSSSTNKHTKRSRKPSSLGQATLTPAMINKCPAILYNLSY